jgi:hypothetical protein
LAFPIPEEVPIEDIKKASTVVDVYYFFWLSKQVLIILEDIQNAE